MFSFSSAVSLTLLNLVRMFLPIFIQPLVIKMYGLDEFAFYVFFLALIPLCSVIFDYGFSYTCVRDFSEISDAEEKVNYFNDVLFCKLLNALLCFPIIATALYFSSFYFSLYNIFVCFFIALSFAISPVWYYQSIGKLTYATYIEIVFLVLSIPFLFFVSELNFGVDIFLIMQASFRLLGYIILYYKINNELKFFSIAPRERNRLENIKIIYIKGSGVFFFRLITSSYVSAYPIILSFLVSPKSFAIYMVADRLFRAGIGLLNPMSQILYANNVKLKNNRNAHGIYVIKSIFLMSILGLIGLLFTYLFSEKIILSLFGEEFKMSIQILSLLSILFPVMAVSNILGIHYHIVIGKERLLNIFLIFGAIVCISLLWVVDEEKIVTLSSPILFSEFAIFFLLLVSYAYHNTSWGARG